jgi:hypothetical protein
MARKQPRVFVLLAAVNSEVEGMWGQHGGRELRKPNFVICSQVPYRCAMGPMSNPRRKARDTVAPTSVECAWAWGAKAARHRKDPYVHASIHPRLSLPCKMAWRQPIYSAALPLASQQQRHQWSSGYDVSLTR